MVNEFSNVSRLWMVSEKETGDIEYERLVLYGLGLNRDNRKVPN